MKYLKEFFIMLFMVNGKLRFARVIGFMVTIIAGTILILNVGFKIPIGGGYIEWKPADVKIDYKKGN